MIIKTTRERQAPTKIKDAEPSHLARYKFALKKIKRKSTTLDSPCGTGYGSNVLSKKSTQVIGIDRSRRAISHARECFQNNRTEFITGNIESQSSKVKKQVDYIVSFEGIEHLKNPEKFVGECYRTLSENGKLIISTPKKPHGNPYHIREFTLTEFKKILSNLTFLPQLHSLS